LVAAGACVRFAGDAPVIPGNGAPGFVTPVDRVPFPGKVVTNAITVDHSGGGNVGACIYSPAIQLAEALVGSIADPK
jgi:hypothetical protein